MADAEQDKFVTFEIDGREVRGRVGESVLRTALDHGIEIPYYCWHPGLSVVASCRMCLVEMDDFDPKTKKLKRLPKLVPSCQTPVKEGIRVHSRTDRVRENQRAVMEFLLLNHPLDCPVCDQAGECYLQDFSYRYGTSFSRMADPKTKQPKKDCGEHILLYADRCILCSRCVRFCREVSGHDQAVFVDRADHTEVDLYPGKTLDDRLAGNVVDICPVGAFLSKEFLFRERVWYLRPAESVCTGCATGCSIWIDSRDERIGRFRPRYNPVVNGYWMCDDGRLLWQNVYRTDRLLTYELPGEDGREPVRADQVPQRLRDVLTSFVRTRGAGRLAAVLSPMLDCELAYLIARVVRGIDPQAVLAPGPAPASEADETFKSGFTISRVKVPNVEGVSMVLDGFGGPRMTFEEVTAALGDGRIAGLWLTGGYFDNTLDRLLPETIRPRLLIVQDSFESSTSQRAHVVLPLAMWVEREGTFVNRSRLAQVFQRSVLPPMGVVPDGQWLARMVGITGVCRAETIRRELAVMLGRFETYEPPALSNLIH